ncbi:hypothetical protein OIU85_019018 [Salix viminalis]|uniref:Uncharacterized protein n=1 Tax=Salix viminalis TaxID=40686 RepID=A0A9Q0ZJP5_SALVM|nr:hypothetical protein OIU85_019018 [Salix viminalis]
MARKRVSRNWLNKIRRKVLRSSHRNIILSSNPCSSPGDENDSDITEEGDYDVLDSIASPPFKERARHGRYSSNHNSSKFQGTPCETGVPSTQEPGEIASVSSRGACKEAITHSPAMHARARPVAGQCSCKAASQPVQ